MNQTNLAPFIHPSAVVESPTEIGDGTRVWHGAHIRANSSIGRDCVVGGDAFIDEGVVIGDRVKIQNRALIYHGATIGSGVFIGPGAIITNDRYPRALSLDGELAGPSDWTLTPTTVGDGASIGAGAIIVAGCDIGRYALVAAGSVVTRTVPDHSLMAGNPARRLGWVCLCGRRLVEAGAGALTCANCSRQFEQSDAGVRPA